MIPKHPLVGLVTGFRSFECEHTFRGAGRGRVVAALPDNFLLVEVIPRDGDDEPAHMIVVSVAEPELRFYETVEQEEDWFRWIMADPERVVQLVKP